MTVETMPQPSRSISPRTGEPKVPIAIVIGTLCAYLASTFVIVSIGLVLWTAVHDYAEASWLMGFMEAHKPQWVLDLDAKHPPLWSGYRIAGVFVCAIVSVTIVAAQSIAAFYSFRGFAWARWAALVAFALSFLSLLLNVWAWPSIGGAVILAGLVWLPINKPFFAAWASRRDPMTDPPLPRKTVEYGPLPRYTK